MAYKRSANAEFNVTLRKHLREIEKRNEHAPVPRPDTCTQVCERHEGRLKRLVNFFRRKKR